MAAGRRGVRHIGSAVSAAIPLVIVALLVSACTLFPQLSTASSATIPGEPNVLYEGEPQGVADLAIPTSNVEVGPLSPLQSTPEATPQRSENPDPSSEMKTAPATTAVEDESADAEPLLTPTPALDVLLEQPVATSRAVVGGLAGAAGLVVAPAPSGNAVAEDPESEEETGGLPLPALAPAPLSEAVATSAMQEGTQPDDTPQIDVTPDGTERELYVPILMYHYLSVPPADANIYRKDLSVAPDLFAQHLDKLLAEGYTTISLYDFTRALQTGAPLPEKPVILTFDDGYRDNYEHAFPALRERGMTATFFVVTDFIDEERSEYMTWEMAREMLAGGMSIESHGRNHASLEGRNDDYLIWQALGSLETIEYEVGVRPRFVAYPAGEYDADTQRIFASAGYWAGVTTMQGATHANDNLFELTRVRMRGTTTPDELIRLLKVDW